MIKYFEITKGTPSLYLADATAKKGIDIIAWVGSQFASGSDIEISQELGDNKDLVVSQKRLTEEFNSVHNSLNMKVDATRYISDKETIDNQIEIAIGEATNANSRVSMVETELEQKANTEGDYPDMSVGVAENLVGRGEAVDTMFSYRSSGGVKPSGIKRSIETGDARITSIKGNSVVVNQLAASIEDMVANRASYFGINADGSVYTKGDRKARDLALNLRANTTTQVIGNKYAVYYDGTEETIALSIGNDPTLSRGTTGIFTATKNQPFFAFPFGTTSNVIPSNTTFLFDAKLTDLTQMFGVGNEPTTVEEFYARVGELSDEYNAGTLRDMQVSAIETTGFNQFNGTYAEVIPNQTYYLGGTYTSVGFASTIGGEVTPITIPSDKLYTPSEFGYIYAEGSDICINLSHSGYKDGTYKPYEVFRRAMPDLSKYFKGGVMRSAGNVCDEFRYNPTTQQWEVIQRVGVVDLGSLDWKWFDAFKCFTTISMANSLVYRSLLNVPNIFTTFATSASYGVFSTSDESRQIDKTMSINPGGTLVIRDRTYTDNDPVAFKASLQGVMLNYELAEPTETPVTENLNLVYDVNDFGTERAIQPEDSAPFRADVVYGFNAIDTIRTNAEAIEQLFARVAALESKTTTTE